MNGKEIKDRPGVYYCPNGACYILVPVSGHVPALWADEDTGLMDVAFDSWFDEDKQYAQVNDLIAFQLTSLFDGPEFFTIYTHRGTIYGTDGVDSDYNIPNVLLVPVDDACGGKGKHFAWVSTSKAALKKVPHYSAYDQIVSLGKRCPKIVPLNRA